MPDKRHSGLLAAGVFTALIVAALLSACTATHADGTKYTGEFRDHTPTGQGTVTLPNGIQYTGEFRDYTPTGQGAMTLPYGTKFIPDGEFSKDGKLIGYGTFITADGAKFAGEFTPNILMNAKLADTESAKLAETAQIEFLKKKEQEDDKKCQSFGAKIGTQPYILCRISLLQSRDSQQQRAEEEARRNANAERHALQRSSENAALQQQRADDIRLRADADRRQRLLQLGDLLSKASRTPAPAPAIWPHGITCHTFGRTTTCN